MYGENFEAFDDENIEAYDDEAFDDESGDDEARPRRLRFRPRQGLGQLRSTTSDMATGVDRLVVTTPRGPITLNLQEKLVREEAFKTATGKLEHAINRNAARANATQRDLGELSKRVSNEVGGLQKSMKRLRRDQQQSMMLSLMFSFMQQGQTGGNNALLLLPLMMMSGSEGGGGNDMMPLVLLLALKK
jgi:hypothetical protein